jgi:hypothetical protein
VTQVNPGITTSGAMKMSKEQRSNKESKKKPLLNQKEKKALKKNKNAGKKDFIETVNN